MESSAAKQGTGLHEKAESPLGSSRPVSIHLSYENIIADERLGISEAWRSKGLP